MIVDFFIIISIGVLIMGKRLFKTLAITSCLFFVVGCDLTGDTNSSGNNENTNEHVHSFSTTWSKDETYHWHKCKGCDEITDKSEHTYGVWVVDLQPTENSTGFRHRSCLTCDYQQREEIPILEHVHNWDEPTYSWNYDHSTCTAKRECTINRYHVESETVNSTYEVIDEPTETANGLGRYTAVFINSAFRTQTYDVTINKIGIRVTGVSLTESIEISSTGTYTLIPTITPYNADNKSVTWSSSDPSVATVTSTTSYGYVQAVKEGTTNVTVTTVDGGYTATCVVTVKDNIPVTGISLASTAISMQEGTTKTLTATISPSNATNKKVTWYTTDSSIVGGTYNGTTITLSANKVGTATVTVQTEDGGYAASCVVTVLEKENFSYVVGTTVVETYTYSSSNYIKVYTPITNNGNVNIYVFTVSYDIEDSAGNLKDSISEYSVDFYPQILKPGETGYAYVEKQYKGDTLDDLVAVPHPKIKNAKSKAAVRYQVSDLSLQEDTYYVFRLLGRITNNQTEASSSLMTLSATFFDKDGKLITQLWTYPGEIQPGESLSFSKVSTDMYYHRNEYTIDDIASYQVYACEYEIVI